MYTQGFVNNMFEKEFVYKSAIEPSGRGIIRNKNIDKTCIMSPY